MSPLTRWREMPWPQWRRQAAAVVRLELRKCFLGKRLIAVYFLALAPLLLMGAAVVIKMMLGRPTDLVRSTRVMAGFFQVYMLRLGIFFGCAAIFTNTIRGEVLEKTLHYYFLTPIRREVLMVGKFIAGLYASLVFFGLSTAGCFLLVHLAVPGTQLAQYFRGGAGPAQLGAYLAVTALACLGYGAAFTLFGALFRNPVVPALLLMGWENINFLLPPLLQKISVIHYLQSLCPVAVDKGPLAVLVEPTPPALAVAGLLALAVAALGRAAGRLRRMEIAYATD